MAKEQPSMFFVIIPFAFKLIILQETKIKGMIFLGVTFWVQFIHVLVYKLCVSKHYINESSSCIEVAIVADNKKVLSKMDVRHLTKYLYQVLAVEQVSVDAKEGGNDCCIYLAVEQVYYT